MLDSPWSHGGARYYENLQLFASFIPGRMDEVRETGKRLKKQKSKNNKSNKKNKQEGKIKCTYVSRLLQQQETEELT